MSRKKSRKRRSRKRKSRKRKSRKRKSRKRRSKRKSKRRSRKRRSKRKSRKRKSKRRSRKRKSKRKSGTKRKLSCNRPQKSWRPGKKKVVRACSRGREKIIHFGATGYGHNYSSTARKSFRARQKCSTAKDKLTARYWACKNLWTKGGNKKSCPKNRKCKFGFGGGSGYVIYIHPDKGDGCPSCSGAAQFLQSKGIPFEKKTDRNIKPDWPTWPKIFKDGKFIGGFSDLKNSFNK